MDHTQSSVVTMADMKEFASQSEMLEHFGKDLGWKVERGEFVNLEKGIEDYQTADDSEENVYPEPEIYYKLHIEKENASLEESYFWTLHFLRFDCGFSQIDKIYDIFSAAESSAMFGSNAQRLSIQQDRASQYLVQIGQLVKQLFPLVRELRIIDERLEMYNSWKKNKSADISLKHLYIQLVEGGTQNPDSVYGLAQRVGYTILPDLFLNTHVYTTKDINKVVDEGSVKDFNESVKTVLRRKLYLYIIWKEKTQKELDAKRKFQLQYLRQHWGVIKLYMAWIRPYMKTAGRLERDQGLTDSADIISAFDNARSEIEILAKKPQDIKKKDGHYQCIIANFKYKTTPKMTYNAQYGQQNVAHAGSIEITFRAYGWHKTDIEAFKKMRQKEDIAMLKGLDAHISGAFDAFGKDIEEYLEEAEEEEALEKKVKKKKEAEEQEEKDLKAHKKQNKFSKFGPLEPFLEIGSGFSELFTSMFRDEKKKDMKKDKGKEKEYDFKDENNKEAREGAAKGAVLYSGITYQVYKKAHKHLGW